MKFLSLIVLLFGCTPCVPSETEESTPAKEQATGVCTLAFNTKLGNQVHRCQNANEVCYIIQFNDGDARISCSTL